jgi:hypothetical protein
MDQRCTGGHERAGRQNLVKRNFKKAFLIEIEVATKRSVESIQTPLANARPARGYICASAELHRARTTSAGARSRSSHPCVDPRGSRPSSWTPSARAGASLRSIHPRRHSTSPVPRQRAAPWSRAAAPLSARAARALHHGAGARSRSSHRPCVDPRGSRPLSWTPAHRPPCVRRSTARRLDTTPVPRERALAFFTSAAGEHDPRGAFPGIDQRSFWPLSSTPRSDHRCAMVERVRLRRLRRGRPRTRP